MRPLFLLLVPLFFLSCATNSRSVEVGAQDFAALARGFYDSGDIQRAAQYYELALNLDPDLPGLRFDLARSYLDLGRPEVALPLLNAEALRWPDNLVVQEALAYAHLLSGNPELAAEILLQMRLALGKAGTYNLLLALLQTEKLPTIEETLAWIPKLWLDEDAKLAGMAGAAYAALGQRDEALELLRKAESARVDLYRWELARILRDMGEYQEVLPIFEGLYESGYRKLQIAGILTELYFRDLDDREAGFLWLKRARDLDPDFDMEAYLGLLSPSQLEEIQTSQPGFESES